MKGQDLHRDRLYSKKIPFMELIFVLFSFSKVT